LDLPFSDPIWQRPANRAVLHTPLGTDEIVDVAIVGGGLQGLSTAYHAASRGLAVRVIEARRIGQGASGLNGGQVIPGLKHDPESLIRMLGEVQAERLIAFAARTADAVFNLIRDGALDVPHRREGWIQACHTRKALDAAADRHRQWQARGADAVLLGADEMKQMTGNAAYVGGWLDRRAGVVDPLSLTLELARIASEAGARIAEKEAVDGIGREAGGWRVSTGSGNVIRAKKVVVATNAYSEALVPGLRESLVALHSFQIATAPLPAELLSAILPGGQAVSDSRRILNYYRIGPGGRFVLGGRGRMSVPKSEADWRHLERSMARLYPALEGIPVERRWFGRVAVTPDYMPRLHAPQDGLIMLAGCQGRGVGMMTAIGHPLADFLATGDPDVLPFPLSPIRPIPFHRFRRIGVGAHVGWYRLLDRLEQ
jgi:glycine/D-amino acid oxidase-like deaminating enzyme